LNPYRGCIHGCKYCYAPNIIKSPREQWGKFVEVKKNIPNLLARELKNLKSELIGISSVTDPYQKTEERFKLTRYCLEQLLRYKFPVSIITKSPLVLRDVDLIKKLPYSELTITITTLEQNLANVLEPKAPTIDHRLEALTELSEEGLNTYAFLGPLLPTLELENVPEFIDRISATGVKNIMVDTLNLKPGIWPAISQSVNHWPDIKDLFYKRLFVDKDYYIKIFNLIKLECSRNNVRFDY
jgi:DNA repair photolyase